VIVSTFMPITNTAARPHRMSCDWRLYQPDARAIELSNQVSTSRRSSSRSLPYCVTSVRRACRVPPSGSDSIFSLAFTTRSSAGVCGARMSNSAFAKVREGMYEGPRRFLRRQLESLYSPRIRAWP
jgi:hypothetical protein